MRARATAAAVAVAQGYGLRATDPVVLRDGSNTLVHLKPHPVVARVAVTTGAYRPGPAWLDRELLVAGTLAAAGAPVVAPATLLPAGPHARDGLWLSFWSFVNTGAAPADLRPAGAALRDCHALLAASGLVLPRASALDEVVRLLPELVATTPRRFDPAEVELLSWWAARLPVVLAERVPPTQPVHGDAHLGNVLHTADGPLWNDWEDAFHGPRGWDFACALAGSRVFGDPRAPVDAFLDGYGDVAVSAEDLGLLVDGRVLQAVVWGTILAAKRGQRRSPAVTTSLAWLRARRG